MKRFDLYAGVFLGAALAGALVYLAADRILRPKENA